MLLLQFLSLALLASKHVAGIPTEAGFRLTVRDDCGVDGNLTKRAPCTQPVQCGTNDDPQGAQQYSVATIKSAVNWAKRSFPDKEGLIGGYPKYYGASDNGVRTALPADCSAKGVTLYEFPIGTGPNFTPNYKGGDPGPDRIVLGETTGPNGKSRFFCLVMTHRGLDDNAFKVCPPSTG